MSTSREKLDAWHAELAQREVERRAASERERQQRIANAAKPAKAEPEPSTFDADRDTSRGIRSVWD